MPLTHEAEEVLSDKGLLISPGKAANAGGVAVSGLEMSQNAIRRSRTAERVDRDLRDIMQSIHDQIAAEGRSGAVIDYRRGASIAGYRRLAKAMSAQGVI